MTKLLEKLDWDSNFFGFPVFRCYWNSLIDQNELVDADIENNSLVYLFSNAIFRPEKNLRQTYHIKSFEGNIEYEWSYAHEVLARQNIQISEWLSETTTKELNDLCLQSGIYSRFYLDSSFSSHLYKRLYLTWLKKSLDGILADHTFVIDAKQPKGFITLKRANTAEIGLLAVDQKYRGKGLAKNLVRECQNKLIQSNIKKCRVKTQIVNQAACKLYEDMGFREINRYQIFHLWRKQKT